MDHTVTESFTAILLGLEDEVVHTFALRPDQHPSPISLACLQQSLSLLTKDDVPYKTVTYDYDKVETELAQLLHGPHVVVYRRVP